MNWIVMHHGQIVGYLVEGSVVLNGVIQFALYLQPLSSWLAMAERRPRVAALVRLLLAVGVNPLSALQSVIDLVRNEASKGSLASAKALEVSVSRPLISPPKGSPQ